MGKSMSGRYTIGIGDFWVTEAAEGELVTYALGSCVAVILAHPSRSLYAMIHIALPEKNNSLHDKKVGYYADEGLNAIFQTFERQYKCKSKELIGWVIGGADAYNPSDFFNIGSKNVQMVSKILREKSVKTLLKDTGGNVSRTVIFDMATQSIQIKTHPMIL